MSSGNDWQARRSYDDLRDCPAISLSFGMMKATGFYTEAEIMLTDEEAGQLIRELQEVRRKLDTAKRT